MTPNTVVYNLHVNVMKGEIIYTNLTLRFCDETSKKTCNTALSERETSSRFFKAIDASFFFFK